MKCKFNYTRHEIEHYRVTSRVHTYCTHTHKWVLMFQMRLYRNGVNKQVTLHDGMYLKRPARGAHSVEKLFQGCWWTPIVTRPVPVMGRHFASFRETPSHNHQWHGQGFVLDPEVSTLAAHATWGRPKRLTFILFNVVWMASPCSVDHVQ